MTGEQRYELVVSIQIRDRVGYGSLSVSESVQLNAASFMEMASLLAKFHELAESLKAKEK